MMKDLSKEARERIIEELNNIPDRGVMKFLTLLEYPDCGNKESYLKQIEKCDWQAAKLLAQLIKDNRFGQDLGGWAKLYLLCDNDIVVSFVTLSAQDCVAAPDLSPWLGFLYTAPEYRGRHYAELLINHACKDARQLGYGKIYLATDSVGLYENEMHPQS